MADFTINGLNGPERLPLKLVFNEPEVERVTAIAGDHAVFKIGAPEEAEKQLRQQAEQAYRSVDELPQSPAVLTAAAIMTSPVMTLAPDATIAEALALFEQQSFRHIPIVSGDGRLIGILSDRDLWRNLAAVPQAFSRDTPLQALMSTRVLAASSDTDVRHIARLFVEQRIGALPVADEGELKGIVTRSDVLAAVMRHYRLHLWT